MRPVLFSLSIGRSVVAVHSYGALIGLGLAVGIALMHREARRRGMDAGRVLDLAFWMVVSGLIGARVLYVLVNARDFVRACADGEGPWWRECTRVAQVWQGGLVFYGGVVAAGLVTALFCRREGWSFGATSDLAAPALAIGHAFGRLGCFAAGCCFGKPTTAAIGVTFPPDSVAFDALGAAGAIPFGAHRTPPLHPTQLYEAAGELAIFALLLALRPRLRPRPGALLAVYLGSYAALRFVVEMFRGDSIRGYVIRIATPRLAACFGLPADAPLFLSLGQVGSLIIGALVAISLRRVHKPRVTAEA
jgi:phosphatidylglycerol---prolipoprotein diacylglyceryl transferase